jgi:hypothetical protein
MQKAKDKVKLATKQIEDSNKAQDEIRTLTRQVQHQQFQNKIHAGA